MPSWITPLTKTEDPTTFNNYVVEVVKGAGIDLQGPAGEKGVPGATGATGPQGPAGSGGASSYVWNQAIPATVWDITHNLGFYPAGIIVEDSGGAVIAGGDIDYISVNELTITFANAFGGTAYIS
jgi:hypothetical protein